MNVDGVAQPLRGGALRLGKWEARSRATNCGATMVKRRSIALLSLTNRSLSIPKLRDTLVISVGVALECVRAAPADSGFPLRFVEPVFDRVGVRLRSLDARIGERVMTPRRLNTSFAGACMRFRRIVA